MGERKGVNKYYPPDYDPKFGGLNKFLGTHALRERARKLDKGILIIRFELPFNIWCNECNNHIGMGVRYNAEKTKIGMYFSTPVHQFRMKCHLCDNHFEIKTDPGNLQYVVVSGARRQENRWDAAENEQIVPESKETQKKLFDDAMFKLEHKMIDSKSANDAKPRLQQLVIRNDQVWSDSFSANQKLRQIFRAEKKEIKQNQERLHKLNLNLNWLPDSEEDRQQATILMQMKKASTVSSTNSIDKQKKILSSSIFPHRQKSKTKSKLKSKKTNSRKMPEKCKKALVQYSSTSDSNSDADLDQSNN